MKNPKFIISKEKILTQYNEVREVGDIISYSSKTNPIVTRILEKNTDSMFSIHLSSELKNIDNKSRVIFLIQGCDEELIDSLVRQGIRWFVVDNEKDLEVFLEYLESVLFANSQPAKVNLLLRIKLKEMTLRTERYFVFGMSSEVVNKKLKELRDNSKIDKLGIHFHRKTQNMAEWNLISEFNDMIDFDNLGLIDFVCIGGGLPVEYANTNVDVISSVLKKIKEFREYLKEKGIETIVEPGRFLAAPAGKLMTQIVRVYDKNIIVNASVYNSDMDSLVVPVKLKVEGELNKQDKNAKPFVVKGITPCSMDLFRYRVYLDEEKVKEGEEIVFLNAGAYNFWSDFCDLEKIETEVV